MMRETVIWEALRVLSLLPVWEALRVLSLLPVWEALRALSLLPVWEAVRALSILPVWEAVRALASAQFGGRLYPQWLKHFVFQSSQTMPRVPAADL